jgi:hypothetical protein
MANDYDLIQRNFLKFEGQYKSMQQCARHMYAISVECIQELEMIKKGSKVNIDDFIIEYKAQIGKYNKIVISDQMDEKTKIVDQAILQEHKKRIIKTDNQEVILEVLLSLRYYGLQLRTNELKINFINEVVQNDILCMKEKKSNFVIELINSSSYILRQATLAIISMIISTGKGIEYLTTYDYNILLSIIEVYIILT